MRHRVVVASAIMCSVLLAVVSGSATTGPVRVLVVTGGHDYPTSFYTVFEQPDLAWDHATSSEDAFRKDVRSTYDVIVLYDMSQALSDQGRKHFQDFVESGKGLVVLHHAIVSYHDWPWYHELVGAHYWEQPRGTAPASTYKHDEYIDVNVARPHPVTSAVTPVRLFDETYKSMWFSPRIIVLLTTDNPTSDGPLAWITPHAHSRVVTIQLGHGAEAHRHRNYRTLVRNAILWSAGATAHERACVTHQRSGKHGPVRESARSGVDSAVNVHHRQFVPPHACQKPEQDPTSQLPHTRNFSHPVGGTGDRGGVGRHDSRAGESWRGQQDDCPHGGRGAQYRAAISTGADRARRTSPTGGSAIDRRRSV